MPLLRVSPRPKFFDQYLRFAFSDQANLLGGLFAQVDSTLFSDAAIGDAYDDGATGCFARHAYIRAKRKPIVSRCEFPRSTARRR